MEQVEQLGQQVSTAAGPESRLPLRTQLLVLQPTPFCNLDCRYCYLPQRDDRSRMSLDTLRLAARRLADDGLAGDELGVVWHAGEPLVMPSAWYEDAFGVLADELRGTRLVQAMQSNAVCIDAAWCRFFLRHGVQLGVSVDGPAAVHDSQRHTRRGGPTHAAVTRGIAQLQALAVPFHAIAVVTAATLGLAAAPPGAPFDPAAVRAAADAFHDWFAAQGITRLGFNIDEAEGAHRRSSLAGHAAAYAVFLERLLERAAEGVVAIREFDAAEALLRAPLPRWMPSVVPHAAADPAPVRPSWPQNTQVMPLALLTVLHDGRFSTFSPELAGQRDAEHGDFVLGNVHAGGYRAALDTPRFARLWAEVAAGVAACQRSCAHFEQCGGGAPANKRYENGSFVSTQTLHCASSVQAPFDAVLRAAERALRLAA